MAAKEVRPQRYENLESAGAYSLLTRDTKFPILQRKKRVIIDST